MSESAYKLQEYASEVGIGDNSNREGHAAKVYFNALFGTSFGRGQEIKINAGLNYGYQVILACISREISANGFLLQLGIFHSNTFNSFNLASDLMEPFRPVVDDYVLKMNLDGDELDKDDKQHILRMLECNVVIDNERRTLLEAMKKYTRCALDAICSSDTSLLRFFRYEF